MAEIALNIMMDAEKVQNTEKVCDDIGMSLHEPGSFYLEANLARLRRGIAALNNGEGIERELIKVDDE
ncbi:MAG: hypothetical protein FWB71_03260 [Defluviitaleaceae bacterium]|nr:hypothetical protein [Defluviitaleaceae bacterium]